MHRLTLQAVSTLVMKTCTLSLGMALLPRVYLSICVTCMSRMLYAADKDMVNLVQSPSLKTFRKPARVFLEAGLHVYLLYVYVKVTQ